MSYAGVYEHNVIFIAQIFLKRGSVFDKYTQYYMSSLHEKYRSVYSISEFGAIIRILTSTQDFDLKEYFFKTFFLIDEYKLIC